MTLTNPRILKPSGFSRHELPAIAAGRKREHQHAPRRTVHFAVWPRPTQRTERRPARADHELADAAVGVEASRGILRREALVIVIVTTDDNVDAELVERPPHIQHLPLIAMFPGAEDGFVEVRHLALRLIRGELGTQPRHLA